MKSKLLLVVLFVCLAFAVVWVGSAVECNTTNNIINSTSISDGCTLLKGVTYTMSGEVFNLNGSTNGAIMINSDNVLLDCNNSIIYGNYTFGDSVIIRGIRANTRSNTTLRNCILKNYYAAIDISGNNHFYNNIITNYTFWGIRNPSNFTNVSINNSSFYLGFDSSISLTNGIGFTMENILIKYSNISSTSVGDINNFNVSNVKISNISANSYIKKPIGVYVESRSPINILINNSNFQYAVQACTIFNKNSSNIRILNSVCNNTDYYGFDFYSNASNVLLMNNIIQNIGSAGSIGFNARDFDFGLLGGNFTSIGNIILSGNTTGISFSGANGGQSINDIVNNIAEGATADRARNINYTNLTIINVTQCIRFDNYSYNLFINNLTCELFRRTTIFQANTINLTNISIINSFNYLNHNFTWESVSTSNLSNLIIRNVASFDFDIIDTRGLIFNLSYTKYGYFYVRNLTIINLYNQSNSLIYFSNNSVACQDINSCDGNINISLSPKNYSYILQNFNVTEGVPREHSPIWFSSSTTTSKHIASNLSQTIDAVVVINIAPNTCNNLAQISYRSDTGAYTETFHKHLISPDYTCSDGIVTLDITGIEPAVSSNVITLTYNYDRAELSEYCASTVGMFDSFAELISLIILAIVFVIIVGLLSSGNMNFREFLVGSIITIVFVAIINIFGSIIVSFLC